MGPLLLLLLTAVLGVCNANNGFNAKQQYDYFYEGVVRHNGGRVSLQCTVSVQAVTSNNLYCRLSNCQYEQNTRQSNGQSSGYSQGSDDHNHGPNTFQGQYEPSDGQSEGHNSGHYQGHYNPNHGQSTRQNTNSYSHQYGQNNQQTYDQYQNQFWQNSEQYPGQNQRNQYQPVPTHHSLHKPFNIEMKHGVFHKLKTEKSVPMWVTNVQKSVVSLFQLDIRDKSSSQSSQRIFPTENLLHRWRLPSIYSTMEKSQYGECETTYQVMPHDLTTQKQITRKQLEDDYSKYNLRPSKLPLSPFTVIKSRNTANCSVEAAWRSKTRQNSCRSHTECTSSTPMTSYQSNYVLEGDRSHYTIHRVYVTSHVSYGSDDHNGNLNSVSEQTLLLKKQFPMGTFFGDTRDPKHHEDIYFRHPTTDQNDMSYSDLVSAPQMSESSPGFTDIYTMSDQQSEWKAHVLDSLQMIDSELNGFTAENHGYVASAVIEAEEGMSYLDYKSLDDIRSSLISQTKKEIYYDLLAMTGSNPTVEMLVRLMEQHQIPAQQASRIMSLLSSQIKTPNVMLMKRLDEFSRSDFVKDNTPVRLNLVMALGNLFYRTCVQSKGQTPSSPEYIHGAYCNQDMRTLMKEFITKTEQEIHRSKLPEKMALIQSIGNVGSPAIIPVVQHILASDSNKQTVTQAIYALRRLGKTHSKEVQDITSVTFQNRHYCNKIRVAAATILLGCDPPLQYWKDLAMSTWTEPSEEVKNFVSSAIESYAETNDDSLQSQRQKAQQCLSIIKPGNKNWSQSRKYNLGSVIKNFVPGATGRSSVITGTHTNTPHTLYMSMKNFVNGFSNGEGRMTINGADVNHVIDEIANNLGDQVERRRWSLDGDRLPEGMRKVMQQLQASRSEDIVAPSLSALTSWNQYMQSFHQFDTMDYYNLKMKMKSDYSFQFKPTQGILYLEDQVYSIPSETGLATFFSEKVPLVLSLRGQVDIKWQPSKSRFQLTMTDTTPTVAIYRRTSLRIANPLSSTVLEVGEENSFHVSAPVDADFQIDLQNNRFQTSIQLREQNSGAENFQVHSHRVPYYRSASYGQRSGLGRRQINAISPVCHYHPENTQQYGQPNLDAFSGRRDYFCDVQKAKTYHVDYNIMSEEEDSRFEMEFALVDGQSQTPEQDHTSSGRQQQYPKVESTLAKAQQILHSEKPGHGAAIVAVASFYGRSQKQYAVILASNKNRTGRSFSTITSANEDYACFNFHIERPKEEKIGEQFRYRAVMDGDMRHGHGSCSQPGVSFKAQFSSQDSYRSSQQEQGAPGCHQSNGQGCDGDKYGVLETIKLDVDLSNTGENSMLIQGVTDGVIDDLIGNYGEVVQRARSHPDQMKFYARINYDQSNIAMTRTTAYGLKTYQLPLPIDSGKLKQFTMLYKSERENWDNLIYGTDKTTCLLHENLVKSFDGNMVNMKNNNCHVVLTHCLFCSYKVLITSNLKPDRREVRVYVKDHEVVLRGGGDEEDYNVEFDSQPKWIPDGATLRVADVNIEIEQSHHSLHVDLLNERVLVELNQMTGEVKVVADPRRFGGRLRGVCGNMDGESRGDMVDQQQCVHTDQQTFADSYRVSDGTTSSDHCYPRRLPSSLCARVNTLYSPSN